MAKQYLIDDFVNPLGLEQDSSDEELFEIRGGVYDHKGKEYLEEKSFVSYLIRVFCAVLISGSVVFYNWARHLYEVLDSDVYMSFFKILLDEINPDFWNTRIEASIKRRFELDIPRLKEFTIPEDYIVFNNGVFRLSDGTFIKGDHPEMVINPCCTGYSFKRKAKCPGFLEFLDDIFNGDEELIAVVQEVMGYTLSYGSNPMQSIVILIGGGRNGKGILANICQKVHGIENCSGTSVTELSSQFGLSSVYNKVLNISSENNENIVTDTSILKAISGNDTVRIDKKYKDPIIARIYCKLWMLTNNIRFRDRSKGFEERIIPIPFKNTYVDNPVPDTNQRQKDNNLEEKLDKELAGIFNWMYEGYIRLKGNDWRISESSAVNEERNRLVEVSNPIQSFVNACIDKDSKEKVRRPDIYESFSLWAKYNNVSAGNITRQDFYHTFDEVLKGKGIGSVTKKIKGEIYYKGIVMKDIFAS